MLTNGRHGETVMVEEWKDVTGFEGVYSISSMGRLRREYTTNASPIGRIVKGSQRGRSGHKYVRYTLHHNGKSTRCFAHTLVLRAFIGDDKNKMPHHINNNSLDNSLSNLKWVTSSENTKYAYADGRIPSRRGEASNSAKLSSSAVAEIRARYGRGSSCATLATAYGIHKSTAHRIATRRTWK